MRLVHQTIVRAKGYAVYYFEVHYIQEDGLDLWRPPNNEEFSQLQSWQPRLQEMCDKVMGHDVGKVRAEIVFGKNCLYLQIPEGLAQPPETVALIGWIELQGLETRSPRQPTDWDASHSYSSRGTG